MSNGLGLQQGWTSISLRKFCVVVRSTWPTVRHPLAHSINTNSSKLTRFSENAPSLVRDQIADHESNAVKYYINEIVEFDTAAAFLQRPSNEAVQKEARMVTLMADMTAPKRLDDAQSAGLRNHPKIRRQVQKCQSLKKGIKGNKILRASFKRILFTR